MIIYRVAFVQLHYGLYMNLISIVVYVFKLKK